MSTEENKCPEGKLFVPGKDLPNPERVEVREKVHEGSIAENDFKLLKNNILLAPLVQAFNKNISGGSDYVLVGTVGFFDTALNLTEESFNYKYHLSLNLNGSYELVVYIFYAEQRSTTSDCKPVNNQGLVSFHFKFPHIFTYDNVFNHTDHTKTLKDIKTVKVHILSVNPETSRGTETTVQDDDE